MFRKRRVNREAHATCMFRLCFDTAVYLICIYAAYPAWLFKKFRLYSSIKEEEPDPISAVRIRAKFFSE